MATGKANSVMRVRAVQRVAVPATSLARVQPEVVDLKSRTKVQITTNCENRVAKRLVLLAVAEVPGACSAKVIGAGRVGRGAVCKSCLAGPES